MRHDLLHMYENIDNILQDIVTILENTFIVLRSSDKPSSFL